MATITFNNGAADGGKWSTAGNWDLGHAPTGGSGGDDAVIPKNLTCMLDTTGLVAKSVTLNVGTTGSDVGGILSCITTANWDLTVYNGMTGLGSSTVAYNSRVNLDMSASPTYTGIIYTNGAAGTASSDTASSSAVFTVRGKHTIKGASRVRWTFTSAVLTANTTKSVHVDDATGWLIGDKLIFATTQAYNATPRKDLVTIATITFDSGTTGAATVTWTDGVGTTGAVLYDHADNCLVGNLQSNLVISPVVADNVSGIRLMNQCNLTDSSFSNVEFRSCKSSSSFGAAGVLNISTSFTGLSYNYCTFYEWTTNAVMIYATNKAVSRTDNQYYTTKAACLAYTAQSPTGDNGDETNPCLYQCATSSTNGAFSVGSPAMQVINPMISGVTGNAAFSGSAFGDSHIVGGGVWACNAVYLQPNIQNAPIYFDSVYLGKGLATAEYSSANNANLAKVSGAGISIFTSCPENLSGGAIMDLVGGASSSELRLINENNNAASQNIYRCLVSKTAPVFVRDVSLAKNADASMRVDTLGDYSFSRTFPILVKGGVAATIFVYARKTGTFSTRPTAQLTGLGTAFAAVTMSTANNTWELLDLSYAAGSAPSADGELNLVLTCQAGTSLSAYFSGLPIPPFITRNRNYGYLYDETTPIRTVNITVSASEATAIAYTGIAVTGGTTTSSSIISANHTFQEFYDYGQAWGCSTVANIAYVVPLTGAGLAGSPSLFAQGSITINTTKVINGAGSIAMGSYLLTTETASAQSYTYTGGTWSQLTTVPTFNGGTTALSGEGTWTFNVAASQILTFAPTANAVTYGLGAGTFAGTLDLRNTHATRTITVELPTGTSYTTANNTGAAITVSVPVVTADISITSMPNAVGASDRLQIINTTALSASVWVANTVYATGAIVKRTTGIGSESTAGLYFRATTGGTSHATTEPTWDTTVGNTTADGTVVWTTYAVLFYDADPASTSYATTYIDGEEFLEGETVTIRFAEMDAATSFKDYSTDVVVTSSGFSALVAESADDVYATFALDGSAYDTTYSPNYVSDYIVLDTNTDFSGASAFAYFCYIMTTSQGMYEFWGGMTGVDAGNVRIESDILDLYFDSSAGFVKQTDNVRIYRKDGVRPALDPTSDGYGVEINWRTPVNVITTSDQAINQATVEAGLTAQGYTTTRAPYLDKLPSIEDEVV